MNAPYTLVMPFPPPVNNLFVNRRQGGRFPSKRYVAWKREADLALMRQKPLLGFLKPVSISIYLGRPDRRKRDLDGLGKAILDRLVAHGVLEDDSDVQCLSMAWDESGEIVGAQVEIAQVATREVEGAA